ncbi:hypothetical protein EJ357_07005 [Streptomyces cyaneochromogenes]|uniref:Uncharacterized protein n=1 Tax=Streptomyces cyaneochromogenes TaxID=2496836 RepID=A0A3S9M216_9ACTN|nr:hypothetical protein [Streptomyces cyaneochromogenes]AZQ33229.1 hypothetical protein EJ357_07005 [Streptomyces cyaneochromogenes]
MVAVISGLCGLAAAALRIRGRTALAREQRRAMAVVIVAARGTGRSVTVRQQVAGTKWSVDIGTDRTIADGRTVHSGWAVEGEEAR